MINLGNDKVIKIYLGNDEVNKIYLGDVEVYNSTTPPPPTPYKDMYLTFEIISGGTISLYRRSTSISRQIEYSVNNDEWTSGEFGTTSISVQDGDIVRMRGDNSSYAIDASNYCQIRTDSTVLFNVYGNIMSLFDSTGYTTANTFTENNAIRDFFNGCKSVVSAENLILPATAMTNNCYKNLFKGCTSLTSAPELPATTLAQSCYDGMFYGCTGLTTAPELPVTTLVNQCYREMFRDCTALNYIKCLATDISASSCTNSWVRGVTSTGTFVKNPNMSSWTTSYNGIPSGWTVQDAS